MPILPVLDLMQGQIVRGIAGRRDEYRPIVSKLVASADPIAVARTFREQFGFREFYLADLDAIRNEKPAVEIYRQLQHEGYRLWIDAGLRTADDAVLGLLRSVSEASVVVGLESVAGPSELRRIAQVTGIERIVFSLDLKAGRPLGQVGRWPSGFPIDIVRHAIEAIEIGRVIVLDLANVGVGEGVHTQALCASIKREWPDVQLTAGGGVRGMDDVKRLVDIGVDRVLVASALHDGRITV